MKKDEVDKEKKTQKKPLQCAKCHKNKKTRKHHWPLGSGRLVPLCNHCYTVVKKQRNRAIGHFGIY